MVTKVEAYRADDGSLHKTELEAHEQNFRKTIVELDNAIDDDEIITERGIRILWANRTRLFNLLKRIPGIDR